MAFFSSLAVVLPAAATPGSSLPPRRSSFRAAPVLLRVSSGKRRVSFSRAATASLSVRCEQSSKQGGGGGGSVVDVWASRLAMMSFAAAVVAEVSTGKGLVENFGVATPAPALALVVTALVIGLAVLFIVRSGSQD